MIAVLPDIEVTDLDVIETMERFGGSFVRALANLARTADAENLQRIKNAWPEYWERYSDMATMKKLKDQNVIL